MDNNLVCVYTEYKKYVQLLRDAEWDGTPTQFYQTQVDHYKELIDDGAMYEPKFQASGMKKHDSVGTFYDSCNICGGTVTVKDGKRALCADCWEKKRKQYQRPNPWKRKNPDST